VGARVVILRLDTPGGLDASTRAIIHRILGTSVPVVGYVAPRDSRAASAGTYILYATHVAVMAPATNLGAGAPVQIWMQYGPVLHEETSSQEANLEAPDRKRRSSEGRRSHPQRRNQQSSGGKAKTTATKTTTGRHPPTRPKPKDSFQAEDTKPVGSPTGDTELYIVAGMLRDKG